MRKKLSYINNMIDITIDLHENSKISDCEYLFLLDSIEKDYKMIVSQTIDSENNESLETWILMFLKKSDASDS